MKNSNQKKCKNCSSLVPVIDKHEFCKPCRQPIHNVFDCPGKCIICDVINRTPQLQYILKKHEFKRYKKERLLQVPSGLIENEKCNQTSKHENTLLRSSGSKNDGCFWKVIPNLKNEENVNKTIVPSYGNKVSSFSEFKAKLSGRANINDNSDLSTDLTSDGQSLLHTNKPEVITKAEISNPEIGIEEIHLFTKFREFIRSQEVNNSPISNVVPICGTLDSNLSEKHIDVLNSENKKDVLFKVSSKASDILLTSTVLNSPLQADKLRKKLKLKENSAMWPSDLSHCDLLDIHTSLLPTMKLHPKVRHLQKFLFGKLTPVLPRDILASDFILPPISLDLEDKFLFARKQLQRSLFMFSVLDSYDVEQFKSNVSIMDMFQQLFCHLTDSIETQGNLVGLLLHDIRKELLQDVICKDNDAITKLITGSVDETHFFGPYVKVLQSLVKNKGSSYCLRYTKKSKLKMPSPKPSLNLAKLPKPFEIGDNVHVFLKDLQYYFINNEISENDKVAVLETLLPSAIVDKITLFHNPAKSTTKLNFDEISIYFERVGSCGEKTDYLSKRFNFTKVQQESNQSTAEFAKRLQQKIIGCNYGLHEKEFLRDQFIFGLKDKTTQQELLEKYYFSFEQCVTVASSNESKTTEKAGKAGTNNKSPKVLQRESVKKENEVEELPLITSTKKKIGTKESVKLKENNLNEQKPITTTKRKLEVEECVKLPVKKVHLCEDLFYSQYSIFYDKPKLETVHIKSKQQWNSYYGTEALPGYKVLCPWTGKILRAK